MIHREVCRKWGTWSPWVPKIKLWPLVRVQAPQFLDSYWTVLMAQCFPFNCFSFKTMFYIEVPRRTVFIWGLLSSLPTDRKHLYFSHWLHELWRLNVIVLILKIFLFLYEVNSWTHFYPLLWNACSEITALTFSVTPWRILPFVQPLNYIVKINIDFISQADT